MTRYFDTSFLVPLLISEPRTAQVEKFFESLPEDETLLFSRWGQLGSLSVLSKPGYAAATRCIWQRLQTWAWRKSIRWTTVC